MSRPRADAARNRAALLQAAEVEFLEKGINAPLNAIAARAGVGRATLFRNFADRDALIAALTDRGLEEIEAEAQRLGAQPDALAIMLQQVAQRMVLRAPLAEYWRGRHPGQPETRRLIERILAALGPLLERAVAAGQCRDDLVPSDLMLLLSMLCGSLYGQSARERERLSQRAMQLVSSLIQPATIRPQQPEAVPAAGHSPRPGHGRHG